MTFDERMFLRVIEDHFVQGRPKWEQVGAQMTTDVLPYEKMKLRLLNASHQALLLQWNASRISVRA